MPDVPLIRYPETIRLGEPFSVEGNGWVDESIELEIQQDNKVIWSKDIMTGHGKFTATEFIPATAGITKNDAMLYIISAAGGSRGYSVELHRP
ncbi:hypothetical protein AB6A23_23165 [Paenibacillus tarimensis]